MSQTARRCFALINKQTKHSEVVFGPWVCQKSLIFFLKAFQDRNLQHILILCWQFFVKIKKRLKAPRCTKESLCVTSEFNVYILFDCRWTSAAKVRSDVCMHFENVLANTEIISKISRAPSKFWTFEDVLKILRLSWNGLDSFHSFGTQVFMCWDWTNKTLGSCFRSLDVSKIINFVSKSLLGSKSSTHSYFVLTVFCWDQKKFQSTKLTLRM